MAADEQLALAQAVSSFQSLIVFDSVWTGLAESIEQRTEDEQGVLTALVGSILQDLERARVGATWLQNFVLDEGINSVRERALTAAKELPDGDGSVIQDVDEVYGELFGQFVEDCYGSLRDSLGDQRRALVQELARLLNGQTGDGDLFKNILCGISGGMTVGGLIFTAVPPHITGPLIVTAGVAAVKAFKCDLDDLANKKKWRFV
jgi:hypothetical protein